jgi:hypothetical protein
MQSSLQQHRQVTHSTGVSPSFDINQWCSKDPGGGGRCPGEDEDEDDSSG